jgi:hypothetical protein
MTRDEEVLYLAGKLCFVREVGGQNKGVWVNTIQKVTGNGDGDSWCASFVSLVLGIAYEGKSPLPRTASCDVILEHARDNGWLSDTPDVGDVFLCMKSPTDAYHTGFVAKVLADRVETIEGNSNDEGSANGDRACKREGDRARKLSPGKLQFVKYPR